MHLLRTGGDASYADIDEVVPWIDFAWELGQDLDVSQPGADVARLFKSHARLSKVHEGCKVVTTLRDPAKQLASWYTFLSAKRPLIALPHIDKFCDDPFLWAKLTGFGGHPLEYLVEAYKCRNVPTCCVLCFEHMVEDPHGTIETLAEFMGVECTEELASKVVEMSSLDWMSAHFTKYDERWMAARQLQMRRAGFMRNAPASRVALKPSSASSGADLGMFKLTEKGRQKLQRQWDAIVKPQLGFTSYKEMTDALKAERLPVVIGEAIAAVEGRSETV